MSFIPSIATCKYARFICANAAVVLPFINASLAAIRCIFANSDMASSIVFLLIPLLLLVTFEPFICANAEYTVSLVVSAYSPTNNSMAAEMQRVIDKMTNFVIILFCDDKYVVYKVD